MGLYETANGLCSQDKCSDCGASPCDCDKPIWSYRYRGSYCEDWGPDQGTRASALAYRQMCVEKDSEIGLVVPRGPVQRITDPPYEFAKAVAATSVATPAHTAQPAPAPNVTVTTLPYGAIMSLNASGWKVYKIDPTTGTWVEQPAEPTGNVATAKTTTAQPVRAKKYPAECPCGIFSGDCEYHKDVTT